MNFPLSNITHVDRGAIVDFSRSADRIMAARRLMHRAYHKVPIQRNFFENMTP